MLDHVLQFKGEAIKTINIIGKNNLYILAHDRFGFDSYVVLSNLAQWRIVVSLIKKGSSIVSFKIFNGYVKKTDSSIISFYTW